MFGRTKVFSKEAICIDKRDLIELFDEMVYCLDSDEYPSSLVLKLDRLFAKYKIGPVYDKITLNGSKRETKTDSITPGGI